MKRNCAIDLVRIYAALVVVVCHLVEFFGTGVGHVSNTLAIYVEFFLMVSGFFMMKHLDGHMTLAKLYGVIYPAK